MTNPQETHDTLQLPALDAGAALVKTLFAAEKYAEALELSEHLRACGVFDAEAALLQAICMDRLGFAAAAEARLAELQGALGPSAAALIQIGRKWIGDGPRGSRGASELKRQALRFTPRLAQ